MTRHAKALVVAAMLTGAAQAQAEPMRLELPLACSVGTTCFVQNYVDRDSGAGVLDYRCGAETYDGHDGVDIRVLSLEAAKGVKVLAPAAGVVKGRRDGVPDHLLAGAADKAAVAGRECGNGLVIDNGSGWETQLCHMRQGSVAVAPGDTVAAGQPVGEVGASGAAAFAHVHLTVRHDGKPVDPFTGTPMSEAPACGAGAPAGTPLWSAPALAALGYRAGEIIEAGFAGAPVSLGDLEARGGTLAQPRPGDDALVFYARFMNLKAGDRLLVSVEGPGGFATRNEIPPLDRAKAIYVAFSGKKRTAPRWPAGRYLGRAQVLRDGAAAVTRETSFDLAP